LKKAIGDLPESIQAKDKNKPNEKLFVPNSFKKYLAVFSVFLFLVSYNIALAQDPTETSMMRIKDVKIEKSDTEIKISGSLFNPSKNVVTPEITHLLILKTIDPLIKPKSETDFVAVLMT